MQGIDWKLYQEDPFYRDLVDRMLENEQEAARLRQQLRAEQAQFDAEATYRRQRMLGYANQLPYRETTPVRPMQWSASYPAYQDNFVNYWSASTQSAVQSGAPMPNQEELHRVFHSAVDCTAQLTKENAPVPSIIFDGLGLLTAGNLFEAAKSALSIIDTAKKLML